MRKKVFSFLIGILLIAGIVYAANLAITSFTALSSGNIADTDVFNVVDISDTTMDASGTNKKYTWASLKADIKTYADTLYEAIGVTVSDISDASANGRSLISAADYAAMKGLLDLEIGTDVLAPNGDGSGLSGVVTSESDPNALLTAGTDNVKDTHIDFGTGAGQVSADDIPDGSTNAIPTLTQESNWDTAYGWGDHSLAGYLTAEVDGSVTNELPTAGTAIDVSGTQVSFDATELEAVTWGAADGASITWTWDLIANDPSVTFGPANVTFNDDVNIGGDDAGENLTIHSAGYLTIYDASDDTSVQIGPVGDGTTVLGVTGTINATALQEGGNDVYNSSETPGGELGGTWASPTIDDGVAVSNWNLTTPTITTSMLFEGGTYDTTFTCGTPTESVSYRLPLADGNSAQVLHTDGSGNLYFDDDDTGSAPTWNSLQTAADNLALSLAGYTTTFSSTLDTGTLWTFNNTDADLSGDTALIDMKFTDDGDANGFFIRCYDNSGADLKFSVGPDGAVTGGAASFATVNVARSATPTMSLGDSDCTDSDDNWTLSINATDTGSGTEDIDVTEQIQIAGTGTTVRSIDADGDYEVGTASMPLKANGTFSSLDIPAIGNDPDVATAGYIGRDNDDHALRGYDGSAQYVYGQKIKQINASVVAPNDMADSTRDKCIIWQNRTPFAFIVTGWYGVSDTDDTTLNIEEYDGDGQNNATVDAVEIATDGTGIYYASDATITAGTIEAGHMIALDFDDTDKPGLVQITLIGYYNGDVD